MLSCTGGGGGRDPHQHQPRRGLRDAQLQHHHRRQLRPFHDPPPDGQPHRRPRPPRPQLRRQLRGADGHQQGLQRARPDLVRVGRVRERRVRAHSVPAARRDGLLRVRAAAGGGQQYRRAHAEKGRRVRGEPAHHHGHRGGLSRAERAEAPAGIWDGDQLPGIQRTAGFLPHDAAAAQPGLRRVPLPRATEGVRGRSCRKTKGIFL